MRLRYYLTNNKRIYTLKEKIPNSDEKTREAHYKFIRIKSSVEKNLK